MDLSYTLIKSKRKTISLEMKPDGSLIVRAPNRTTKSEADAFVKKHEKWVENHRKKMGERKAQAQSVQRLTQAELLALGRLAQKVSSYALFIFLIYIMTISVMRMLACSRKNIQDI
jgi:predicted metal-dependent hydrolase